MVQCGELGMVLEKGDADCKHIDKLHLGVNKSVSQL